MSLDRLRAHYGFTRQPFGRDLAPGQLFQGRAHQEAVARIRWLVDERGIGVVTGEVGAGKTVSARAAVSQLDSSRFRVVYLPNPAIGGRGLHMHLVYALGGVPRFHTAALINQTQDLLAAETDEKNKTVLLVVDEAHLLSNDQLEQLRLLTNSDMDARSQLALVLLGQPTLRGRLKLGHFAALDQRISVRYHIDGLRLDETVAYVKHHAALALLTELRTLASNCLGVFEELCGRVAARAQRGEHFTASGVAGHPADRVAPGDRRPVGAVPAP